MIFAPLLFLGAFGEGLGLLPYNQAVFVRRDSWSLRLWEYVTDF